MEEKEDAEGALRARFLEQDVTDDFCAAFGDDPDDYRGSVARLVASGILIVGVNDQDPRVRGIIRRCREANPDAPWLPDRLTTERG